MVAHPAGMYQLGLTPLPAEGLSTPLRIGIWTDHPGVGVLQLNRPDKGNAFGDELWSSFAKAVRVLEAADSVRCILICGEGHHFCTGIDKAYLQRMFATIQQQHTCPARLREAFRAHATKLQDTYTVLEQCRWPVIAAVHGACVGGGIDLITACDMRVCSQDASFCVKEIDLAIAADLGTLQRLPHIVGYGAAADLAMTCRTIGSEEALNLHLVTQVLGRNQSELLPAALKLASEVAAKPPLALVGTKRVLQRARDVPGVANNLDYVAVYNAGLVMFSDDIKTAMTARKGTQPQYSKL